VPVFTWIYPLNSQKLMLFFDWVKKIMKNYVNLCNRPPKTEVWRLFSKFFTANILFWEHLGVICFSLGRRSGNTSNQNKYLFLLKYLNHSQIVLKHFSLFSLIGIEIEIEIEIVLWRLSRKIEFSGRKPCQFAIVIRHLGFCRTCQKKKISQLILTKID